MSDQDKKPDLVKITGQGEKPKEVFSILSSVEDPTSNTQSVPRAHETGGEVSSAGYIDHDGDEYDTVGTNKIKGLGDSDIMF